MDSTESSFMRTSMLILDLQQWHLQLLRPFILRCYVRRIDGTRVLLLEELGQLDKGFRRGYEPVDADQEHAKDLKGRDLARCP